MDAGSNSFTNTADEGNEEIELINKKIENLNEKLIKKKEREFVLKLNLSKNQFYEITDDFLDFKNLVSLDMTENYLENITNLYYLVNLEILILAKNFISNIGNVLTSLQNLQFLDLCFNKLVVNDTIIKSLGQNRNLFSLSLRGNINYDFEKVKIKCLEHTEKLEMLDTIVIYQNRDKKVIINNTINYCTKKGEKVKIKTLKDYMNVRIKDLEENENFNIDEDYSSNNNEQERNYDRQRNNKNKLILKDSYIENLKARKNNIHLNPKSYYYYSNSMNIQLKK